MTPEEFDQILNSEPRSQDPAFLEAKRSDLTLARKAADAEAFEQKLERALALPVDNDLTDRILSRIDDRPTAWQRWPVSLAAAATVVIAVSLAILLPDSDVAPASDPVIAAVDKQDMMADKGAMAGDPMVAAFYDHLMKDKSQALASTAAFQSAEAEAALAEVGIRMADSGMKLTFAYPYPCPVGGPSMHLVMTDEESRQTTVLFSPAGRVEKGVDTMAPDNLPARAFNVAAGAVYVVAHDGQPVDVLMGTLFGEGAETASRI
ncbi:MAG: DUF3379 family protein [Pseudomonadota bacterium]